MPSDDSPVLYRRAPKGLARTDLREYAEAIRDHVAGGREFVCLITDDRELQRLNKEFLDRDYPTDVLSFPAEDGGGFLGEIAISAARAADQAASFGHTLDEEIKILMLHGLLHLMGLDHERDRGKMAREEKSWRRKLQLPSSLIERNTE